DVAGNKREDLADRPLRALAVVAAVKCRDLPDLDLVEMASRRLGAATDDGFRVADVVAMEAVIDVDAVADGATRRERPVMGRGHEDLRRLGYPGQRGRRVPERARTATQECLDEADAAFDLDRGGGSEPKIPDAAVPGADAEHGSAAAQEGEGSNRRRRGRR